MSSKLIPWMLFLSKHLMGNSTTGDVCHTCLLCLYPPLPSFSIFTLFLDSAKLSDAPENGGNEEAMEEDQVDNGVLKLTKAERRAKQKKIKKISKKQEDVTQAEEVQPTSQAAVLVFFRDFTFLFFF